jgi:hypothetical protein
VLLCAVCSDDKCVRVLLWWWLLYDLADVCCSAGHVCAAIERPGPAIVRVLSGRSIQQKRRAQYCPTMEWVLAAETRIDYTQLRPIKAVALVNLLLYCTSHSSSTIYGNLEWIECCSSASRATAHQQFDKVINVRDLSNIYSNVMITTLTFYLLFDIITQNLVYSLILEMLTRPTVQRCLLSLPQYISSLWLLLLMWCNIIPVILNDMPDAFRLILL